MRVCHVISGLSRLGLGPTSVVLGLAGAMARLGHATRVACVHKPDTVDLPRGGNLEVLATPGRFPRFLSRSPALRDLLAADGEADLFHGHGVWQLPVHYMAAAARAGGRPYVITPHGMLEPWALRRSAWKKAVVRCLFAGRDLAGADCLHAMAPADTCVEAPLRSAAVRQ